MGKTAQQQGKSILACEKGVKAGDRTEPWRHGHARRLERCKGGLCWQTFVTWIHLYGEELGLSLGHMKACLRHSRIL